MSGADTATSEKFGHLQFLNDENVKRIIAEVLEEGMKILREKDREYGASWKRRGGIGAYMMLARKWDRLENALEPNVGDQTCCNLGENQGLAISPFDIIRAGVLDSRPEGIIDDIRDLRNYLLLVEAGIRYEQMKLGEAATKASPEAMSALREAIAGEEQSGNLIVADLLREVEECQDVGGAIEQDQPKH